MWFSGGEEQWRPSPSSREKTLLLFLLPPSLRPSLLLFAFPRVMRILDMNLVGRNFFEPAQATVIQHYRWVLDVVFSCRSLGCETGTSLLPRQ